MFGDEVLEFARDPRVFDRIIEYLSKTVKRDDIAKRLTFLVALSAYTKSPLNVWMKGPSSIGKSYLAREVTKVFPEGDVWSLGGVSPTAIIHDPRATYDEEKGVYVVDLWNKILVFYDLPKSDTLAMLRPILSHDKPEIEYRITEKSGKGKLKAKIVRVRGWPALISCTTDPTFSEQDSTRSYLLTPEMAPEKYRNAINLQADQDMLLPEDKEDPEKVLMTEFIGFLKEVGKLRPELHFAYADEVAKKYPDEDPRDMRDFPRFENLIKTIGFLHAGQRRFFKVMRSEKDILGPGIILADERDYEIARDIFANVIETTRTGMPKTVLDFYERVLKPLTAKVEIPYADIKEKYYEVYRRPISSSHLGTRFLEPLEQAGFLDRNPDPTDKRRSLVTRLDVTPEDWLKKLEINSSQDALKHYFTHLSEKGPKKEGSIFPCYFLNDSILPFVFPSQSGEASRPPTPAPEGSPC